MAAPTTIDVSVNGTEFCRYEKDYDTIVVTVVATGGAVYTDEEVLVELVKNRRSRDAVVATATVTFNGPGDPQEGTASFYLPDVVDQDLISLIRFGSYFIRATSVTDDAITGESDAFAIRVLTTQKLKDDYLFGLTLAATEVKAPKFQPVSVSGVEITEVSPQHPLGFSTLQFNYHQTNTANATAVIGAGANGTVTVTADDDLAGSTGNINAITVTVPIGTTPLSVSYVANIITVNLSVSAGVPVALDNTATLVTAAINTLPNFTAVASGSGVTAISAASGPTVFTGGLTNTTRGLSWNGGPVTSIVGSGTYLLRRGETGPKANLSGYNSGEFVVVRISSTLLLPAVNTTEQILIDRKKLDDSSLASYIDNAVSWLENEVLMTHIEPTNVVTDRDPTAVQYSAGINGPTPIYVDADYDFLVTPLTYYPNRSGNWLQLQTPYPQVLRVDSLYGAIANTRIIDFDLEWIEINQHGGLLQIVPFNQGVSFDFIGLVWINAFHGVAEIPNFFRHNFIVGLRDATPDIRGVVAKKAAIDALTAAGLALRPGVGSVSLSRDGVSESVSYATSAQYGVFSASITTYKEFLKEALPMLRGKYRGAGLVVV